MSKPNHLRRARKRAAIPKQSRGRSDVVDAELTPAQIRELDRRMADHTDPTRYLLVSQLTARFVLYYNVTDDVFTTDPRGGTLFKRRRTAVGVKTLLHRGIDVLACTSRRVGGNTVAILSSARSRRPTVKPLPSSLKQQGRRPGRRASHR